jgi:hypothetical protein
VGCCAVLTQQHWACPAALSTCSWHLQVNT